MCLLLLPQDTPIRKPTRWSLKLGVDVAYLITGEKYAPELEMLYNLRRVNRWRLGAGLWKGRRLIRPSCRKLVDGPGERAPGFEVPILMLRPKLVFNDGQHRSVHCISIPSS